jgi:bacterioferritin-associated ferredoxin
VSGVPRTDGSWSQTLTFAADDRERLGIVCDRERVSQLESLGRLVGHCIALSGQSLASWLLIGADCGACREQRVKFWKGGFEAAAANK